MNFEGQKKINEVMETLSIDEDRLKSMLSFLNSVNYQINIEGDCLVSPESKPMVNIELSLLEWLQFQAHFPLISEHFDLSNLHSDFRKKLTQLEINYSKYDLFGPLEIMNNLSIDRLKTNNTHFLEEGLKNNSLNEQMLSTVDKAIVDGFSLSIFFPNGKRIEVFPHRVVHMDGDISLISEDKVDKSIVHLYLKDVESVELTDTTHAPAFSHIEIDDFISSLRAISDTEIRLILKINKKDKVSEQPIYQHLGNPCLITNPKGEHIWAASVEPSEALMQWIYDIGPDIEILDPMSFKEQFLRFCEDKLKKIA